MENRTITNRIVIHHTVSSPSTTMEQVEQWHKSQGFACIGYHKFIEMDGTVKTGRPDWAVGAHAIGANNDSIGICLAGNFEEAPPTSFQMKALADTIKDIRRVYGNIPYIGHKDVDPINHPTACPGKLFPWEDLKQRLEVNTVAEEDWKKNIMSSAQAKGLVEGGKHKPDEPASKWFVLQIALAVLKLLGK